MRDHKTYRHYKRNRARVTKFWKKVSPTRRLIHPPLIRRVSKRGEVHYE